MPSAAERHFRSERAGRDAAREQLDTEISRIKGDMEERGIGGRIADEASAKAMAALDEAAQIANESKGVIGGTLVLLALWFFRRPILDALWALIGSHDDEEGYDDDGTR
jgi:hypothetical protein